jgi:hypothetical protein
VQKKKNKKKQTNKLTIRNIFSKSMGHNFEFHVTLYTCTCRYSQYSHFNLQNNIHVLIMNAATFPTDTETKQYCVLYVYKGQTKCIYVPLLFLELQSHVN